MFKNKCLKNTFFVVQRYQNKVNSTRGGYNAILELFIGLKRVDSIDNGLCSKRRFFQFAPKCLHISCCLLFYYYRCISAYIFYVIYCFIILGALVLIYSMLFTVLLL